MGGLSSGPMASAEPATTRGIIDSTASYGGSLYRLQKPDQLVNKPAGEWQSCDIFFRAARFDGEKKTENARITVYRNGVLIHDDFSIPRKTGAGKPEGPEPRPISLQRHQNEVRFRYSWIQRLTLGAAEGAGGRGADAIEAKTIAPVRSGAADNAIICASAAL